MRDALTIQVNGDDVDVPTETTVAALVAVHIRSERGVAVAVNRELVPRSAWPQTRLSPGDRVEILTAAQGG